MEQTGAAVGQPWINVSVGDSVGSSTVDGE